MWDPYAEFQSTTLPNGLTIHAAYWPGRLWETVGVLIHSGAEHDPVGLEGISHFVEHLVAENGDVSKKSIIALFDDCGGMVNLGSTRDADTRFRFSVPIDATILAKAFSIFGHMLLAARLEKSVEKERQIIFGEFHRRYPFNIKFEFDRREHRALYTGCWLDRLVCPLGDLESVGRITQGELQSHYDTHYTPANMSIVCVGGMQLPEIIKLLSESPFAMRKEGVRTPLPIPVIDVTPPSETRCVIKASEYVDPAIEIGIYRSVVKIPGNINSQVIRVAKNILNNVLNEEVREKRAWAYAIGSSRTNFRHFYSLSIGCDGIALEALDQIEKVIEICIASIGNREDLFEQIKRSILMSEFMFDPTGSSVRDGALHDLAYHQRIVPLSETSDDLKRVTMNDVQNLLPWLQQERRWTCLLRP